MAVSVRLLASVITLALLAAALAAPAHAATSSVSTTPILSGYTLPLLVTHSPGGGRTIFIVEQTGKIKRATFRDGRWRKLGTFLDLSNKVNDPRRSGGSERGLLGLAFHPRYQENGRFYVSYTRRRAGARNGDSVVAEYRRLNRRKADPGSARTLMVVNQPERNHNGGNLVFGPDGLLYIGMGDGGGSGDPRGNGQDKRTLLGTILRIDPIDPDGSGPRRYRIPRSNPLVGKTGRNEIWAWGLRNPWRYSFDRKNGNLWIGDVGQRTREEVDRSRSDGAGRNAGRGANYGWSRCEGSRKYPNTSARCRFGTRPIYDYAHGDSRCSVTGGFVHRGPRNKSWRGLYVAGDFCGRLFVLGQKGKLKLSRTTGLRITSFGEDAAGRIFVADRGGSILLLRLNGPRP